MYILLRGAAVALLGLAASSPIARAQAPPQPMPVVPSAQTAYGTPQSAAYGSPHSSAGPLIGYTAVPVATVPPTRLGTLVGRVGDYLHRFGEPRLATVPVSTQATPVQLQAVPAPTTVYLLTPAGYQAPPGGPNFALGPYGPGPSLQR